jgi:hypothetical protein
MAEDADYQKEAKLLAEEFEYSDWEAIKLGNHALGNDKNVLTSIEAALKITLDLP